MITALPSQSESDTNLSPQRRAWAEGNLDPEAQTLLADDEKYFLRQSVSTPCLNAIVKAEGIWIARLGGRRRRRLARIDEDVAAALRIGRREVEPVAGGGDEA